MCVCSVDVFSLCFESSKRNAWEILHLPATALMRLQGLGIIGLQKPAVCHFYCSPISLTTAGFHFLLASLPAPISNVCLPVFLSPCIHVFLLVCLPDFLSLGRWLFRIPVFSCCRFLNVSSIKNAINS